MQPSDFYQRPSAAVEVGHDICTPTSRLHYMLACNLFGICVGEWRSSRADLLILIKRLYFNLPAAVSSIYSRVVDY